MKRLTATVRNGRLEVNPETPLSEGEEFALTPLQELKSGEYTPEEFQAINGSVEESLAQYERGEGVPFEKFWQGVRTRR